MAATDSMPVVKKGVAFRHIFYLLDSSGTAITAATGLDSEVSKDGGAFADCTNEATEVGQGLYYLDLTSTETNCDGLALLVKTTSANAIPERAIFAPQETGDILVTATGMASDVITADALASTAVAEIADKVWDEATSDHITAGSTGESIGLVNYVEAKTTNLPSDPADASDIAASFTTVNTTLGTIAGYIDTEVSAIKTKTDNLPSNTATELAAIKSDTAAILLDTGTDGVAVSSAAVDAVWAKQLTELSSTPAASPTAAQAVMLPYMAERNNSEDTQTTRKIRNDAGTVIGQATLTSSSTGVAQGKLATPS